MSFSIGIIGLPNIGKSTLFKALTKKPVNISNYPFCTISPNVGVVAVPDPRLDLLKQTLHPQKILPTTIEFVDLAGLVKNAHKGEGLGNQFLSRIREVDAVCHVVRSFSAPIDPAADIEIINLELIMADLALLTKRLADLKSQAKSGDKKLKKPLEIYTKIKNVLETGKLPSPALLTPEEKILLKDLNLLTLKPLLYVINIAEENINKIPPQLSTINYQPLTININAKLESELVDLADNEREEYLNVLGLKQSGLDQLITASYKLLNLITFFTCQKNILQAWTIPQGTPAPKAAGKVHTDFQNKFIKAEVINWELLVAAGSEIHAREKGLLRTEGKNYLVQDGDIIHFKI